VGEDVVYQQAADLAIKKTVDFMLKEMAQIDQPNIVTTQMIEGFKSAGGFNDEVDTTYSLIISVVAATEYPPICGDKLGFLRTMSSNWFSKI